MKISTRTIKAIMSKEENDYFRNPIIIVAAFFPFFSAIFYLKILGSSSLKSMSINSGVIFSALMLPSFLIIEEKENKTMDALMLFSVNAIEFLIGKIFPCICLSLLANLLSLPYILKLNFVNFIEITFLIFISLLGLILIGALIGFICRSQSESMFFSVIMMSILYIIPMGEKLNAVIARISSMLSITNMDLLITNILNGKGILSSPKSLLIIILWIIVPLITFSLLYKYKKFEVV